jgi:hypothetical protein
MNDYQANGYTSRRHYLDSLADDFGIEPATVYMMADLLGQNEDFDGLINALDDYAGDL